VTPVRVAEALARGAARLAGAGVESARAEARLLLGHAAGLALEELLAHPERPLGEAELAAYESLLARRERREPVAYLIGRADFYSREFAVDRRVLIPRPETELVAELAIAYLRQAFPGEAALLLADLGTGSGNLAVTLALELPVALVHAVDLASAALEVAAGNARRHGVSGRVRLLAGDLWEPLAGLEGRLHAVVANPPYVAEGEFAGLMPEVRDFEPREALVAGPDGLSCLRRIAARAREFLRPAGAVFLEVGAGQAEAVAEMLRDAGLTAVRVHRDYAGHGRVVSGVRGGPS